MLHNVPARCTVAGVPAKPVGQSCCEGMTPAREETLEFQVPHRGRRLLVHAIRIVFRRPVDRGKNARVAVERFTLVPLEL